jgi:hypothetical protein
MKSGYKYTTWFFILHVAFFFPIIISFVSIATQIKAFLSVSELLGFTSEPYDFIQMYDNEDIFDQFVNGNIPLGFHKEQERAILREYGYPNPLYFYLSIVTILIYLTLYYYLQKKLNHNVLIKAVPFVLIFVISFYIIIFHSSDYTIFMST